MIAETGSSLLLYDKKHGVSGTPFKEKQQSSEVPFSNDMTSVTIDGVTYHVKWGLKKRNIAQYFVLLNIDANGCVRQSQKTRE